MTIERLDFGNGADPLNAMEAAEHFVRYAAAKELAPGRRVLDIACGEGYGSWLLREWGATEVVGIDVSDEAIAVANTRFAREGVRFLLSDVSRACDLLGEERFDLIVCFETIEHVPDPAALLQSLKALATVDAVILVSCPNDHVSTKPGESNPFHLRKYTFAEFKSLAESCLGPPQTWLLGANAQGYALIQEGYALAEQIWTDPADFLKAETLRAGHVLPSQANIRPAADTVLFYMGVWGSTDLAPLAAVSMQSYAAFIEPWQAVEWFKLQLAEAHSHLTETKTQLDGTVEQLAEVNGRLAEKDAEISKLYADHEISCSKVRDLQKEVDRLRRRLVALSDIVATLGTKQSVWHDQQTRLEEANRLRDEKQSELHEAYALFYEANRLLDEKNAELQRIIASRGHRLMDAFYYRLYRIPYLNGLLFSIRRALGKGYRWIRRR